MLCLLRFRIDPAKERSHTGRLHGRIAGFVGVARQDIDVADQPHEKHQQPVVVRAVDPLLKGHPPLSV